jgi:hypothetical protein
MGITLTFEAPASLAFWFDRSAVATSGVEKFSGKVLSRGKKYAVMQRFKSV